MIVIWEEDYDEEFSIIDIVSDDMFELYKLYFWQSFMDNNPISTITNKLPILDKIFEENNNTVYYTQIITEEDKQNFTVKMNNELGENIFKWEKHMSLRNVINSFNYIKFDKLNNFLASKSPSK